MKSDRRAVAIVGGGASGTILAAQLARRGIASFLIDGSGRHARGTAYSTLEGVHLLNVRAEAMSAWSGEGLHFADWFARRGGDAKGFAPRRLYGQYLAEMLDGAMADGLVTPIAASAVSAVRGDREWVVGLDNGDSLRVAGLVLANGNQPPLGMKGLDSLGAHYIRNPWGAEARAAIAQLAESGDSALIIGTGLTMVDLVLSLEAAGHQGRIVALSRRGQVPRAHATYDPAPVEQDDVPHGNLLTLWRWLRQRSAKVGWRAAVDSLRPYSHALWQSLGEAEQGRFLRHARPWWDSHRHRIAPEVARSVADAIAEGRLEIWAGRIEAASLDGGGAVLSVRRRGRDSLSEVRAAYVFDCTGPLGAMARTRDPLLKSLIDGGEVVIDHLGIGFEVDARSRIAGAPGLWAIGPLTKGRYWEIVAVPDIREQAAAIAADVAREFGE